MIYHLGLGGGTWPELSQRYWLGVEIALGLERRSERSIIFLTHVDVALCRQPYSYKAAKGV